MMNTPEKKTPEKPTSSAFPLDFWDFLSLTAALVARITEPDPMEHIEPDSYIPEGSIVDKTLQELTTALQEKVNEIASDGFRESVRSTATETEVPVELLDTKEYTDAITPEEWRVNLARKSTTRSIEYKRHTGPLRLELMLHTTHKLENGQIIFSSPSDFSDIETLSSIFYDGLYNFISEMLGDRIEDLNESELRNFLEAVKTRFNTNSGTIPDNSLPHKTNDLEDIKKVETYDLGDNLTQDLDREFMDRYLDLGFIPRNAQVDWAVSVDALGQGRDYFKGQRLFAGRRPSIMDKIYDDYVDSINTRNNTKTQLCILTLALLTATRMRKKIDKKWTDSLHHLGGEVNNQNDINTKGLTRRSFLKVAGFFVANVAFGLPIINNLDEYIETLTIEDKLALDLVQNSQYFQEARQGFEPKLPDDPTASDYVLGYREVIYQYINHPEPQKVGLEDIWLLTRDLLAAYKTTVLLEKNDLNEPGKRSMAIWGANHRMATGLYDLTPVEILNLIKGFFTIYKSQIKKLYVSKKDLIELYTGSSYKYMISPDGNDPKVKAGQVLVHIFPELEGIVNDYLRE